MVQRSVTDGPRAYASFIFATFLEEQVANGNTAIVRQTWERYGANPSAAMLAAIEDVLIQNYNTSIRAVFPEFARLNYFMNQGTYDFVPPNGVYPRVQELGGLQNNWPQWRIFREKLLPPNSARNNSPQDTAAVVVEGPVIPPSINSFPIEGEASSVDHLGTTYIEIRTSNLNLPPGDSADLELTITLPGQAALAIVDRPRVSVIPIANFAAHPHPGNQFLNPQVDGNDLKYTTTIQDFQQNNRVVVMVSNVIPVDGFDGIRIYYRAALDIQ